MPEYCVHGLVTNVTIVDENVEMELFISPEEAHYVASIVDMIKSGKYDMSVDNDAQDKIFQSLVGWNDVVVFQVPKKSMSDMSYIALRSLIGTFQVYTFSSTEV